MIKKVFVILLLLLANFTYLSAQYFSEGQDPYNIKWKKINTKHVKIIFPENASNEALFIANNIDSVHCKTTQTLTLDSNYFNKSYSQLFKKRMPLILRTNSAISNAFVTWVPKRMEFYTIPDYSPSTISWLNLLSIHEYRHKVQMQRISAGDARMFMFIFGEQGAALNLVYNFPTWFLEGDAVCAETGLTTGGRGREPYFLKNIKAQALDEKIFSYSKAYLGSYKDYVPNHYELGYYLTSYARETHGKDFWEKVYTQVTSNPFRLNNFSYGIKKITGLNKNKFYKKAIKSLVEKWKKEISEKDTTTYEVLSIKNKHYANYKNIYPLNDTVFIAEKTGINHNTQLVSFTKKGNERILKELGYYVSGSLHVQANMAVWCEYRVDKRWDQKSYTVIKSFNFTNNKEKQITKKAKYFSPKLSSDGKYIVCYEYSAELTTDIIVIEVESGKIINRIYANKENQYSKPDWMKNNAIISFLCLNNNQKALLSCDLNTHKIDTIINFSNNDIVDYIIADSVVLYTSAFRNTDEIFSFNMRNKTKKLHTKSKYGAYISSIDSKQNILYYSNYTHKGFQAVSTSLNNNVQSIYNSIQYNDFETADLLTQQENGILTFSPNKNKKYIAKDIKPYRKALHVFNIHSWAPVYVNSEAGTITPGFSIQSQNELSTMVTTLGYEINGEDKTKKKIAKISYQGFYPIIDFKAEEGFQDVVNKTITESYNIRSSNMAVYIPFKFNSRTLLYGSQLKLGANYDYYRKIKENEAKYGNEIYSIEANPMFYVVKKKSTRDIIYPAGVVVNYIFKNSPASIIKYGELQGGQVNLYLPSLFKHHGFRVLASKQRSLKDDLTYSNVISSARGFGKILNSEMETYSLEYRMPLYYPDWSLGKFMYIKRFHVGLFGDYTKAKNQGKNYEYKTTGIELFTDLHLFQWIVPIQIGFRLQYFPDSKEVKFNMLNEAKYNDI